jgi:hypothetical protein
MSMIGGTAGGALKPLRQGAGAVALCALLLGLGVAPGEATTIEGTFNPGFNQFFDYNFEGVNEDLDPEFEFFNYTLRIQFTQVLSSFDLSITNDPVTFPGPDASPFLGPGFKCAGITASPSGACRDFVATSDTHPSLPQQGDEFAGTILVGLRFTPVGWPVFGGDDPIHIEGTLGFSSFMLYANRGNPDSLADDIYRMVHFAGSAATTPGNFSPISPIVMCPGNDLDACFVVAQQIVGVPEPATFSLVATGIFAALIRRRVGRRR